MDARPVGMFDSGIGGLTVAREVFKQLPAESIVYLGDTARYPYGPRSAENVQGLVRQITRYLLTHDIKMLVVACNTATACALDTLPAEFGHIPVLGVIEPGARAAAEKSRGKRVGIIGTEGTVRSNAYVKAIQAYDPTVVTVQKACPLFVPLAEEGICTGPIPLQVAELYLSGFRREKIDTLILGCTHYPLLYNVIARVMGMDVYIINSAEWTVRALGEKLKELGLEAPGGADGFAVSRFFVTDAVERFCKVGEPFLERALPYVGKADLP